MLEHAQCLFVLRYPDIDSGNVENTLKQATLDWKPCVINRPSCRSPMKYELQCKGEEGPNFPTLRERPLPCIPESKAFRGALDRKGCQSTAEQKNENTAYLVIS